MTGVGPRTAKALQIVWRVVRVLLIIAEHQHSGPVQLAHLCQRTVQRHTFQALTRGGIARFDAIGGRCRAPDLEQLSDRSVGTIGQCRLLQQSRQCRNDRTSC